MVDQIPEILEKGLSLCATWKRGGQERSDDGEAV